MRPEAHRALGGSAQGAGAGALEGAQLLLAIRLLVRSLRGVPLAAGSGTEEGGANGSAGVVNDAATSEWPDVLLKTKSSVMGGEAATGDDAVDGSIDDSAGAADDDATADGKADAEDGSEGTALKPKGDHFEVGERAVDELVGERPMNALIEDLAAGEPCCKGAFCSTTLLWASGEETPLRSR